MRLEITRKSNLAIRAMTTLHAVGERMSGKRLAAAVGTSTPFLAQVVTPLVRHGWVESQPGRTGGYELAVDAAAVSVLDVIEAVEGPTDDQSCVMRSGLCSEVEACVTHEAWTRARAALIKELAATSLATLSQHGAVR